MPVWQTAIELAVRAYDLTATPEFSKRYSLRDQIVRATVSVSNNIAEGFDRGTNPDLINLIYIARGPVGEVRSVLCMLERMPAFQSVDAGIRNLMQQDESISNQIGAWIQSLLNSGMKGQPIRDGEGSLSGSTEGGARVFQETRADAKWREFRVAVMVLVNGGDGEGWIRAEIPRNPEFGIKKRGNIRLAAQTSGQHE